MCPTPKDRRDLVAAGKLAERLETVLGDWLRADYNTESPAALDVPVLIADARELVRTLRTVERRQTKRLEARQRRAATVADP